MQKIEMISVINGLIKDLDRVESELLKVKALINDNYEEHQEECEELLDAIGLEIQTLL